MASHLLKEDGGHLVLEDGSGSIILEVQPVSTGDYLVQETDGTSRFTLEDGTGFLLLEAAGPTPTPEVITGGSIIIPRRRLMTRLRREGFEEDEAIAIALLLRTRRRHR